MDLKTVGYIPSNCTSIIMYWIYEIVKHECIDGAIKFFKKLFISLNGKNKENELNISESKGYSGVKEDLREVNATVIDVKSNGIANIYIGCTFSNGDKIANR